MRRSATTSSPPRSAKILGDTFVLEANGSAPPMFRLAGTRLCALFGRELKGESFNRLWQQTGQTAIRELIAVVMDEKVGVVASVTGATSDDMLLPVNLEMLLLPLAYRVARRGPRDRARWRRWPRPTGSAPRRSAPLTLGMFRHLGAAVDTARRRGSRRRPGRLQARPDGL